MLPILLLVTVSVLTLGGMQKKKKILLILVLVFSLHTKNGIDA